MRDLEIPPQIWRSAPHSSTAATKEIFAACDRFGEAPLGVWVTLDGGNSTIIIEPNEITARATCVPDCTFSICR